MAEAAAVLTEVPATSRYEMYRRYALFVKDRGIPNTPEAFMQWDKDDNGCQALEWNKTEEQTRFDDLREQARLFIVQYSGRRIRENGRDVFLPGEKWKDGEFRSVNDPEIIPIMIAHYERGIEADTIRLQQTLLRVGKRIQKPTIKRAALRAIDRALSGKKKKRAK
jgi:hypothetical protein